VVEWKLGGHSKLDVVIDGRAEQLQVNNTAHGHEKLIEWLRQHRVKRIGIEASGGPSRAAARPDRCPPKNG
jgi:transposase